MSRHDKFRDRADSPKASYHPDIAAEIDRPEELLAEVLSFAASRWGGDLPRTLAEFRHVVAALAIGALRDAAATGAFAELFDGIEPDRSDLETCRLILAEILADGNPRLQAKCIDFVHGFGIIEEKTETEIAMSEGVGKAAVSKRCVTLREVFGLGPVHGMKDDDARESYRAKMQGRRTRPAAETWKYSGLFGRVCAG